mgnify:CR=1 FL=1
MKKTSFGRKTFLVFDVIVILFLDIVCLYPMLYVLWASLSNANELMAHSGALLYPLSPNIEAYKTVLKNPMILTGYANTIFVVVIGVSLNVLLTILGAYFLTRRNVMFQKYVMMAITFTMFFSGGMIPFYLVVRNIGLYNSRWALILPSLVNTFNLIIMRTSMQNIPRELEEAARVDGASHMRILVQIVAPLSKATTAVIVLYYGVEHWNAWFNAMLFLNDRFLYPLQLVLREILIQNDTSAMTQGMGFVDGITIAETVKYAVIIVATLPILMIYPFLQKYFVKGVMIGAVKG